MNFEDVFVSNEEVIDSWERLNQTKGISDIYGGVIDGVPDFNFFPTLNGNIFSAWTSTYCYHIKEEVSTGAIINQWIPCDYAKLITPYSIHIKDNTENTNMIENDGRVIVFPIPAMENLNIEISDLDQKKYIIDIFDITGKHKINYNGNSSSVSIDIRDLSSGMYYCRIIYKDKVITKPFSKL